MEAGRLEQLRWSSTPRQISTSTSASWSGAATQPRGAEQHQPLSVETDRCPCSAALRALSSTDHLREVRARGTRRCRCRALHLRAWCRGCRSRALGVAPPRPRLLGQDVGGRCSGWWLRRWPWPGPARLALLGSQSPRTPLRRGAHDDRPGWPRPPAQNSGTGKRRGVGATSLTGESGACGACRPFETARRSQPGVTRQMSPRIRAGIGLRPSTTLPVPASALLERIVRRLAGDAAQRLAEVRGTAHERHREGPACRCV